MYEKKKEKTKQIPPAKFRILTQSFENVLEIHHFLMENRVPKIVYVIETNFHRFVVQMVKHTIQHAMRVAAIQASSI